MSQDSCQRILHESEHSSVDDVTCDRWQPYHVIPTLHEMLDYVHCLYHLLPELCSYLLVALPSLAVNFRRASLQFAASEFASHEADLQCSVVNVQMLHMTVFVRTQCLNIDWFITSCLWFVWRSYQSLPYNLKGCGRKRHWIIYDNNREIFSGLKETTKNISKKYSI